MPSPVIAAGAWRVPWFEYAVTTFLRRRLGLSLFDPQPLRDFWTDGASPYSAAVHHLVLALAWVAVFVGTLAGQLATGLVLWVLNSEASASGGGWASAYTLIPVAFAWHLLAAAAASLRPASRWRWTFSGAQELALAILALALTAA